MEGLRICALCTSFVKGLYIKATGLGVCEKFDLVRILIYVDVPVSNTSHQLVAFRNDPSCGCCLRPGVKIGAHGAIPTPCGWICTCCKPVGDKRVKGLGLSALERVENMKRVRKPQRNSITYTYEA
jgi:hypothetical protein